MTSVAALAATSPDTSTQNVHDLRDVSLDEFLKLMITQLQNQDPLEPMDNSQLLQQISLIRDISATDKLSDTLSSVAMGQTLATASGLLNKPVRALTDDGRDITGVVDRVSVETNDTGTERSVRVHIGGDQVRLENVREVLTQDQAG